MGGARKPWRHAGIVAAAVAHAAGIFWANGTDVALAQSGSAQPPPSAEVVAEVFRHDGDGLTLELSALSHDQVGAFLTARGFTATDAEDAAQRGCFFRTAVANNATTADAPVVTISLRSWRLTTAAGEVLAPAMREDWEATWRNKSIGPPASVAFHWALFPPEQTLAPADHNWGFVTFMLAPGTTFALDVAWQQGGERRSTRLQRLKCAS